MTARTARATVRTCTGLAATGTLAEGIAAGLRAGDVLGLTGPLGAGKTTLVRALVRALGGEPADVVSPTFVLVQHYRARLPVTHVDAYRLPDAAGLRALGHEEIYPDGAVTVIEWADRVRAALPAGAVWIELRPLPGDVREVRATGDPATLARLGLGRRSRAGRAHTGP